MDRSRPIAAVHVLGSAGSRGNRLLDDLVGEVEDPGRDREAQRIRGLKVDHQLEPGRLLDRDICGLDAAKNFDELPGALAVKLGKAGP